VVVPEADQTPTHFNINLSVNLNAPVFIIPENIFDKDTLQVSFHLGTCEIQSQLQPFDPKKDYKQEDSNLYDVYKLKFDGLCLKIKDKKLFGDKEHYLINDIA
jgi:hypothetical protein